MIDVKSFFEDSDLLDRLALRQLAHIKGNWELEWNHVKHEFEDEEDSYATRVNKLIDELRVICPPKKYHDNEDHLAEYVESRLNWNIRKAGNRWVGADYAAILSQGGFRDCNQENLLFAVAGRIKAAMDRGQRHFDQMEEAHQEMLADVFAAILYHRSDR